MHGYDIHRRCGQPVTHPQCVSIYGLLVECEVMITEHYWPSCQLVEPITALDYWFILQTHGASHVTTQGYCKDFKLVSEIAGR